jgi:hypothetical protein
MADGTQPEVVRPEKTRGGTSRARAKSEAPGPGKFTTSLILSSLLSVSLSLLPSSIPLIFKFISLPLFHQQQVSPWVVVEVHKASLPELWTMAQALGQRQMEIFSGDPAAGRRKIRTRDLWVEADAGERGRRTEG